MPADASTVSSASTAGTESRHGDDGGARPERLVAATGTSRSVPGASQTTQTRPRSCLFVTPRQRSRKPYNGWVGSVTSISWVGGTLTSTGVLSCGVSQPRRETGGGAIREQVDRATSFEIDQDRAVRLATSARPVVDAEHPRCRDRGRDGGVHHAQDRGAAARQPLFARQA